MKKNEKKAYVIALAVSLAFGGALLVNGGAFVRAADSGSSLVNMSLTVDQLLQLVSGKTEQAENVLGGLVHNTQETFDAGIAVNGTTVIGPDRSASTTNLYVSGNVTGNLPSVYTATMSSSATTTACTFAPPEDGGDRTILAMWVEDTGTAASLGSVTWQAATGTTQYAITSTATKGVNTALSRSTATVITTTSTPQLTGYLQQRSTEYVNFISGTTTNAGTCFLLAR